MAEYIEREALIEKCKAIIQDKWNDKSAPVSWSHAYADFIDNIEEQPIADVAKVVRCKDCLYATERYGHLNCIHGVSYRNSWNKPDDYCSYGVRKE